MSIFAASASGAAQTAETILLVFDLTVAALGLALLIYVITLLRDIAHATRRSAAALERLERVQIDAHDNGGCTFD